MEPTLAELDRKLDALTAQVAYLAEQAQLAERASAERDELLADVTPIARDALQLVNEQLEQVQDYIAPDDLLRLIKKLVQHGPQFELLLDQLDSLTDLMEIAGPITKDGMNKATALLGEAENRGYIAFARGGMQIADNVVTSFTEDDVRRLGDNIVLILNTVKDMTQPEIMNFVRNTLLVAEREVEKPVDISTLGLLRQMGDPAVRRGLALTMRVLRVIGAQAK